jgi:hypothetical protein
MRANQHVIVAVTLALFTALLSAEARAIEPPFSEGRVTVGGGVRIGGNSLNFGLGGDVGYTLESSTVYLGALADYWFGDHEEQSVLGLTATAARWGWDVLGVVGYDFGITEAFVLRPYGGAGIFFAEAEACTGLPGEPVQCIEASDSEAAGVFGGRALFLLGTTLHLGAEIRVLFAEDSAGILAGNIGAVF